MDNDAILSQSDIDALLGSLPEDNAPTRTLKLSSRVEKPREFTSVAPSNSPTVFTQPDEQGITYEQAVEIAGRAAEAESAPIQASLSRISKRVGALETALERIVELEEEISRLKKTG